MEKIVERINQICYLLEDANEEQDWSMVLSVIKKLDELYEDLDRSSFLY